MPRPAPSRRPARVTISVQLATSRQHVPHPRNLRAWANAAYRFVARTAPTHAAHVVLRIVDAAESRTLNRTWRGKDKPTNVLSFPAGDVIAESGRELGDIVICKSVVAAEARAQGKSLNAHWAHMVVHGMLHLLGYDHVRAREADAMERAETHILAQFDYPDPYVAQD